jgi:exosortase
LAAAAAGLAYNLISYWGAKPEHADRLLILVGAAWAATQLGPAWAAVPPRGRPWLGLPLVAIAAVAIPLGWDVQRQVINVPGIVMWWSMAGLILAATGLILVRHGVGRLRVALFPLVFPFLALPIPSRLLARVHPTMQEVMTTIATATLSTVGIEVERIGFILRLPSGDLGVAEACAGVQMLTTLPAAAAFVAFLRGFGPTRGAVLVILSFPVVILANAFRVVASALIQETAGPAFIRGAWHEALGVVAVLAGVAGILATATLVGRADHSPPPEPHPETPSPQTVWAVRVAALLLASSAALSAAAILAAPDHGPAVEFPLEQIPSELPGGWHQEPVDIPTGVAEMLASDKLLYRKYVNNLGVEGHVWIAGWRSAAAVRGYHHPDVCWSGRGFERTTQGDVRLPIVDGGEMLVTTRDFRRGHEEQFVIYWTQTGRTVWGEDQERAYFDQTFGLRVFGRSWLAEMTTGGDAPRLMVLVGATSGGDLIRRELLGLAGSVASELYKICDWADPRHSNPTP